MENIVIADFKNPAHAEAIVYLLNEYANDEMGGGAELSEFAKANLISELRKRSHAFAVIAFIHNEPAGLAICFEGFSSFYCMPLLNIHDLVVLEKFRGRGISQKLLAKVEGLAKQNGCCKLTLEVLEGNAIAQKAYRSFGFGGYELVPEMGKAMFWQKKLI
jgi:ribosomal protein S18 acetylase RimI-like enzyme